MKILVVFTGGTIGSSVGIDGYFSPDGAKGYRLIDMYRKENSDKSVEFDTVEPYRTLSELLNGTHLQKLIDCIKENVTKDYDGIIVTHGTDTLQFSASALGFALGNNTMPVVLVSSNYILEDSRMNGLANFSAAVDFICGKFGKGVFVSYQNKNEGTTIHRGTRLISHAPYSDLVFSVDNSFYGRFENGVFNKNSEFKEKDDEMDCLCKCFEGENSSVLWLTPYPGINWSKLDTDYKAVLLSSYHSGTMNTQNKELHTYLEKNMKNNIPVFVSGAILGTTYESRKIYDSLGLKILPETSPVSSYIKLCMAIEAGCDLNKIMQLSLGGDITINA